MKSCSVIETETDSAKEAPHAVEVINKNFYLENTFNEQIKNCLRICPLADWKKELIKSSTSLYQNLNLFYHGLSCINTLNIKSTLEQFGIALLPLPTTIGHHQEFVSLMIQYYQEFVGQLVSNCVDYEMVFKYTVNFRKLNHTSVVNRVLGQDYFEKVAIFDIYSSTNHLVHYFT